ncbi:MAG TPA: hypothetical protein VFR24_21830 [Candidatus Angelobacter sp.]|nr:hypothetical protein [Candidatus Angelobacter sp.]
MANKATSRMTFRISGLLLPQPEDCGLACPANVAGERKTHAVSENYFWRYFLLALPDNGQTIRRT